MKNKDLVEFISGCNLVATASRNGDDNNKFAYAVIKTRSSAEETLKEVQEKLKLQPTPEILAYEEERMQWVKEHAVLDGNGNPVKVGSEYKFKDKEAATNSFEALQAKHSVAMQQKKDHDKMAEELMDKTANVRIHKVKEEYLPALNANQLEFVEKYLLME